MKITKKLLGFLNRVFDKDPLQFLALRIRYDGQMTWSVDDAVLSTNVAGGTGTALSIDLTQYTIGALAAHIASQEGYSVPYFDEENQSLSARCLMDGANNQDVSNGDHVFAYTSILWAYLEAAGSQLAAVKVQIKEMIEQMSTQTADDEWLDELGSFYAVPRDPGESDSLYGPRIIATVLRPKGNNIAIAMAIEQVSNGLRARIVDAVDVVEVANFRDGSISFNGAYRHYSGEAAYSYNLFDAQFDVDDFVSVNGFDGQRIGNIIELFRDAGTHLRKMSLSGSITDTANSSSWTETEAADVTLDGFVDTYTTRIARTHDGTITRNGTGIYDNGSEDFTVEVH